MPRTMPKIVSTRVRPSEQAFILAVAQSEGQSVSELLRGIVMPEIRDRVKDLLHSTDLQSLSDERVEGNR